MKILVVDDHPMIREALGTVLRQLDPGIQVLQAGNCEEAFAVAMREPDLTLVLMDLMLPGMNGLVGLRTLREKHPGVPVVVLSASENPDDVMRAIELGAMGFIPKSQSNHVMLSALRLVLAGGVYLPAEILAQQYASPSAAEVEAQADTTKMLDTFGLTPRQTEVLALVVQGKPNKVICRELNLSEATVKIHVAAILRALGVANRTQAVVAVGRRGIKLGALGRKRAPLPV